MRVNTETETLETLECLDEILHKADIMNLDVEVPLTQEVFERLAKSPLGKNLKRLSIRPEYDDSNPPVIDTSLVTFESLRSFDMTFQAIRAFHFNKEQFPELERISIEQPCAKDLEYFYSDLPKLKSLSFEFVTINDTSDFGPSLNRSKLIEYFSGYKLWGLSFFPGRDIVLVLPEVKTLDFYRSDDLPGLKLWTPKLQELNLQACYSCRKVTFMKRLPNGYRKEDYPFTGEMSKLRVNIVNTSFLKKDMFFGNPRIERVFTEFEEVEHEWFRF